MSIETRSRQYGKVFDHWQIREFLGSGSGGKSAVFRLMHTDSITVFSALKVISLIEERGNPYQMSPTRRADYEARKQFCRENAEREVLLMNDLRGRTNVVDYLDHAFVDWCDETGFGCDMLIRMELLRDLRGELVQERIFSEADVLKVGRDICTALELCHGKNILHRDIKPENIFYNEDNNYKLGDFGVSRILNASPTSRASTGIGTPQYWAPEQPTGNYDRTVDIYSLGLVLYELGNGGYLPFATSTYVTELEIQQRMAGVPLPPPRNVSPELAGVILKACAFRPIDRYQTAAELLAELNRLSGVTTASPVYPTPGIGYATQPAQPVYQTPQSYSSWQQPAYPTPPPGDIYGTQPAQGVYQTPPPPPDSYGTQPAQPVYQTPQPSPDSYGTQPAQPVYQPPQADYPPRGPVYPTPPPFTPYPVQTPHEDNYTSVRLDSSAFPTPQPPVREKDPESTDRKILLVTRTIVITVAVVLILALIGFVLWTMSNRDEEKDASNAGTAGTTQGVHTTAPVENTYPATLAPATQPAETTQRVLPQNHPYYSCYDPGTEFVLTESDTRFYAPGELKQLTDKQLAVALAEITARHGEVPGDAQIADYFSYLAWYQPTGSAYTLNDYEEANRILITTLQKKRSGTLQYSSNKFLAYYDPNDTYFMDTENRYLNGYDLEDLNHEEMILIRNEIFARRGYVFSDPDLKEFFYCMDWYVPRYQDYDFTYSTFSDVDEANIELILVYEELLRYKGPSSGNPYMPYRKGDGSIFADSASRRLTEADLEGLTEEELILAENEIYARHGMAFDDEDLLHYFLECYWYHVDVAPGETQLISLNSTENANLMLIRNYRKAHY